MAGFTDTVFSVGSFAASVARAGINPAAQQPAADRPARPARERGSVARIIASIVERIDTRQVRLSLGLTVKPLAAAKFGQRTTTSADRDGWARPPP